MRAVSSPHTNAPAPSLSSISKLNPLQKYFPPGVRIHAPGQWQSQGVLRQWDIPRAHKIPLGRPDSVSCNGHSLQHRMGISLQNRTVHKCSRISLVCVATDILLVRLVGRRELPFQSGGKPAPPLPLRPLSSRIWITSSAFFSVSTMPRAS